MKPSSSFQELLGRATQRMGLTSPRKTPEKAPSAERERPPPPPPEPARRLHRSHIFDRESVAALECALPQTLRGLRRCGGFSSTARVGSVT